MPGMRQASLGLALRAGLVVAVVLGGAVWVSVFLLFTWDPERPLREHHLDALSALVLDVPVTLTLSRADQTLTLTDSTEIKEFVAILLDGESVGPSPLASGR